MENINIKKFLDKHKKDMEADYLITNVYGPKTLKELVGDKNKSKYLFDLKKLNFKYQKNGTSNFDPFTKSISILDNKENKKIIKRAIGEEVAHFLDYKKSNIKKATDFINFDSINNNIREFRGMAGAYTQAKEEYDWIKEYENNINLFEGLKKLSKDKNEIYRFYEIVKKESGCKNCGQDCSKCEVHKNTVKLMNMYLNKFISEVKTFTFNQNNRWHFGGYATCQKLIEKEGKSPKEVFNMSDKEIKEKMKEYGFLKHLEITPEQINNIKSEIKSEIMLLEKDPKIYKKIFCSK